MQLQACQKHNKKIESTNQEIEKIKNGNFRTEIYNNQNKKLTGWA